MNQLFCGSSERMHHVANESVHLVITSPPYNVNMGYDAHDDNMELSDYLDFISRVFAECHRVLTPDGRLCINIGNTGRKPYIPLTAHLTMRLLDMGYQHRGEIIWDKGPGSLSTAWGSWKSPSNPTLRDRHEYILCFSKASYRRLTKGAVNAPDNWAELTQSIWQFNPAHAKHIGHPAPFPIELPKRLIHFYTYVDDVVLDPFIGSGTTAVAAKQTHRRYIGYDISAEYLALAERRLEQEYLV